MGRPEKKPKKLTGKEKILEAKGKQSTPTGGSSPNPACGGLPRGAATPRPPPEQPEDVRRTFFKSENRAVEGGDIFRVGAKKRPAG